MESLADRVRRRDPDRYFCALFAPAARREALFTLYAFNDELARAGEVASEPGLARIRLQWWREVVEGAARRHDVAQPLRQWLDAGVIAPDRLLDMIASREADIEGAPASVAEFVARMRQGPGGLAQAAGDALGAVGAELARLCDLGAAYGVAATLGNVEALAARQRCLLPLDVLADCGWVPEAAFGDAARVAASVRPALTAAGRNLLGPPVPMRRAVLAAGLPSAFARIAFGRAAAPAARAGWDRLAVLRAALQARL